MIEFSQFKTASKIIRLGNAVTYYRNQKMEALGLTSAQSETFKVILQNPGITASQLTQKLQRSQSTVAGILSRLESKGLIIKQVDAGDSRKAILMPSEQGLRLQNTLREIALEIQRFITDEMSEEEIAEFDRLLQIALDHMNAVRMGKE